jgi:hypothetical protein
MVHRIQDNVRAAKSHQENYANKRGRPLEFEVGDHVYLKVFSYEEREEVWSERKISTSLYWSIPYY